MLANILVERFHLIDDFFGILWRLDSYEVVSKQLGSVEGAQ